MRLNEEENLKQNGRSGEGGSGVSPLNLSRDGSATLLGYFDPDAPVAVLSGDLPHWRQESVTYFVTFRLADALPQDKLRLWRHELAQWMVNHPEPHDVATRRDYFERFPQRLQKWLDAGAGSCILALGEPKRIVENALRYFAGQRYALDEFVVAPNHVHALVTPLAGCTLSSILHSWKSFTAHEMVKWNCIKSGKSGGGVPPLLQSRDGSVTIWQKESFDHIVRNPASLEHFRRYIEDHRG